MLSDYNPTVLTYTDGQRYVQLPANHPAIGELADRGMKPVGVIRRVGENGNPEVEYFAADYEPDPIHAGNGGTSERKEYLFRFEDWERAAAVQRRLGT